MKMRILIIAVVATISVAHAQSPTQSAAQPEMKGTAIAQAAEPLASSSRPTSTAQPAPTQATSDSLAPREISSVNMPEAPGSYHSSPKAAAREEPQVVELDLGYYFF